MLEPAFDIPESLRSAKGTEPDRQRTWENSPYPHAEFRPKRWLIPSDENPGGMVFDSAAGPQLAFGLVVRACFGRRLAYLELRLLTAMLFWNFKFMPCAPEYSSYKGLVGFTSKPRQCFVRVRKVMDEYSSGDWVQSDDDSDWGDLAESQSGTCFPVPTK